MKIQNVIKHDKSMTIICKMIEWMNLGELEPFIKSFNPILP
jgi:hypothetical protein